MLMEEVNKRIFSEAEHSEKNEVAVRHVFKESRPEFSCTYQRTLLFSQLKSYLTTCTELNRKCRAMGSERTGHLPI